MDKTDENLNDFSNKLLCIEYPGIVENMGNVLETFGGMQSLEIAVGSKKKYVELNFRPQNIYSKPCHGEKIKKPGILVKIKKNTSITGVGETISNFNYTVIGIAAMTIKFRRMSDFQYLPLIKTKNDDNLQNIFEEIYPKKIPNLSTTRSEEAKSLPLFFPPAIFLKHSRTIDIQFNKFEVFKKSGRPELIDRFQNKGKHLKLDDRCIKSLRKSRATNTIFIKFEDNICPTEPPSQEKPIFSEEIEKVKKLFCERPIWSKIGIQHRTQILTNKLKQILPKVAYYFVNGPWRTMWVKFGCDPRKNPSLRIYQTFDYRIRGTAGLKSKINSKGSYKLYGFKGDLTAIEKFSLRDQLFDENRTPEMPTSNYYIVEPGVLPAARQTFYQYCDLKLPEIEGMFDKLPELFADAECHPKNGFLPEDFANQCREIVNKHVLNIVRNKDGFKVTNKENEFIEKELFTADSSSDDENESDKEGDVRQDQNLDEEEIEQLNSYLSEIIDSH